MPTPPTFARGVISFGGREFPVRRFSGVGEVPPARSPADWGACHFDVELLDPSPADYAWAAAYEGDAEVAFPNDPAGVRRHRFVGLVPVPTVPPRVGFAAVSVELREACERFAAAQLPRALKPVSRPSPGPPPGP